VGQIIIIATRDVDWIEGADYYARLHVGGKVHLLRETLTSLERRLDQERFMRINRSTIINLTRVRSVETHLRGEGMVVLASKERLKVTARRREELERRLAGLHDTA
jgi:two-component system LytT family response regulator